MFLHCRRLGCDGTAEVLDLGDEGRCHRPYERAVGDTEVDLVADRDGVIAEVDHQVVTAHPEDRDALGWLQTVRVHVLAAEGQDCLVHGPAAGADRRLAEGRLSTISPGLSRFHSDLEHDYPELKTGLGLDHFEGRSWTGWHHHATLVTAAHLFITTLRLTNPKASGQG